MSLEEFFATLTQFDDQISRKTHQISQKVVQSLQHACIFKTEYPKIPILKTYYWSRTEFMHGTCTVVRIASFIHGTMIDYDEKINAFTE